MDLALPYVTANLCALFIVGFMAFSSKGRAAGTRHAREAEASRTAKQAKSDALMYARMHVQAQVRASKTKLKLEGIQQKKVEDKAVNHEASRPTTEEVAPTAASVALATQPISGAGVLLVRKAGRRMIVILFGREGVFTDPGGGLEGNELPALCASRELEEESLGTISINIEAVTSHPTKYVNYLGYFIAIALAQAESLAQFYDLHRNCTERNPAPPEWRETNQVCQFFVSDLLHVARTAQPAETYVTVDIKNNRQRVRDRVIGLIGMAEKNGVLAKLDDHFNKKRMVQLRLVASADGFGPVGSPMRAASRGMPCWLVG